MPFIWVAPSVCIVAAGVVCVTFSQSDGLIYIIVIARLPGIYGDVNRPCPRAIPSDSGRFTAINPWPHATTIM